MGDFNKKEGLSCDCDVCTVLYPGCCQLLSFVRPAGSMMEDSDLFNKNPSFGEIEKMKSIPDIYHCEICGEHLREDEGFVFCEEKLDESAQLCRKQCVVCFMEHDTGKSLELNGRWLHLVVDLIKSDSPCGSVNLQPLVTEERAENDQNYSQNDEAVEPQRVCEYCNHVFPSYLQLDSHIKEQHIDTITEPNLTDACTEYNMTDDPPRVDVHIESRPEMALFPLYTCEQDDTKENPNDNVTADFDTLLTMTKSSGAVVCKKESTEDSENYEHNIGSNYEDECTANCELSVTTSDNEDGLGIKITDVWSEAVGFRKSTGLK